MIGGRKMKTKLFLGLLAIVLVAPLYFATRGESAPISKPIEIIFSSSLPAQAPAAKVQHKWGEVIEQKSGGRLKFIYYWSNTLMPHAEFVKGVRTGVADVAPIWAGTQDYMPLSYNIMYLPFMGYPSMQAGAKIYEQLYNKFPALRDEFAGLRRLGSRLYPPVQINTTKKVVRGPSDLKGAKIAIVGGGKISTLVKSMGGAPVEISVGDINLSLSTGVVEGWVEHFPAVMVFGAMPKLPYHTVLGEGGISMGLQSLVMNPKTFDKLPPDVQKVVEETSVWWAEESMKLDIGEIERAVNAGKELKHTFTYLTPQEVQVWAHSATELHEKWIAEMESKGKPAKAIYEEAKRLIKEYPK
jgi:TRAP-type C4-dicarboxylate transport system substrate-binding protein